ncbi:MAG: hypothetical protein K1X38_17850 [Microthrixaceae bacterium]|nr:hypothetical protein [Microthrixaceae bacterium]
MTIRGVSALEQVEAVIANPELFALAEAIDAPDQSLGGRPRHYPTYMWVLFDALISVYQSARRVEAELAHPIVWNHLRKLIERRLPDEPDLWLPAAPMRRHHYLYGRTRYLANVASIERLAEIHREHAADQARELGLMSVHGRRSWTHPDLERLIYADGKVVTPLYRAQPGDRKLDKRTGELRLVRTEADAALHFEGTGDTAWGTKWIMVACRTPHHRGRVILDVDWVPTSGSEASTATDSFRRLRPHLDGCQGVIYDTALRGVHHQTLLRELGWLSINKVTAKKAATAAPRRKGGERVEKSTFVEDQVVTLGDGTEVTIHLFARAGAIGIGTQSGTGELKFTELPRIKTHRTQDKSSLYRWYNTYQLPAHLGGGTVTVRLHGMPEDDERRFNRTENVRQIPPSDPDFPALYRRRNDAESINRALDDTLWLRRAHSVGHLRQHVNMITHALVVNSVAVSRHRRMTGASPPTAQAA